jgi:transposase-like protein
MRSLRRRLTPDVRREIVSRYAEGDSAKALSREFDISRDGVRRLLRDARVTTRSQNVVTPQAAERIVQLYVSGLTIKQVVAQVGYSFGTVQRVLNKHGGVMRVSPVGKRAAQDGKASSA